MRQDSVKVSKRSSQPSPLLIPSPRTKASACVKIINAWQAHVTERNGYGCQVSLPVTITANGYADVTHAQSLLDIAETYAGANDDHSIVPFGKDAYLKNRAETLIVAGRSTALCDSL